MLTVSGVGEFKYEKYGLRFVECIRKALDDLGIDTEAGTEQEADIKNPGAEGAMVRPAKKGKTDFSITEEILSQIHYSDLTSLSDFVGQLNDLRDDQSMKRLTIKSVEQQLIDEGYLELYFVNQRPAKRASKKGKESGIVSETRVSEKGNEYDVLFYKEEAQRMLIKMLTDKGKQ